MTFGLIIALWALVGSAAGAIHHVSLDGSINPVSKDFVVRVISAAEAADASLVILELDTPGGLEQSMRDIVTAELGSGVPIVVFVGPAGARAASAGVLLTLAADVAAMAPGTNIGAAHPVSLIGGGQEGEDVNAEKATNDAAAFARAVAQQRGRNVEWAEGAVRESSALSAEEALAEGVIDLLAEDFEALLIALDGYVLPDGRVLRTEGLDRREIKPTLRERLLGYLADPNVVYILFLLGLYGLIYEFFQPGIGFGLAAGGICLILAFLGLQILPVSLVGIGLILFGAALMILDAFTPTNGILTTGGVVSLFVGSLTLFQIDDPTIGLSLTTVFLMVGTVTALFVFVITKGLLAQRRRPRTGVSGMIDRIGTARTELNPDGKVFVHGEYWDAHALDGEIRSGEPVRVEGMAGRRLLVRRRGTSDR